MFHSRGIPRSYKKPPTFFNISFTYKKHYIYSFYLNVERDYLSIKVNHTLTGKRMHTTMSPSFTSTSSENTACPRLILHFDVNKTLINTDSITGKTKEEVIFNQLAESTSAIWDLKYPKMTYKQYVNTILKPDDSKSNGLEGRRILIKNFLTTIQKYPVLAPEVIERHEKLSAKANDAIFTSFITLITKLQTYNINFKLTLRTFGNDLKSVKKEITEKTDIIFARKSKFKEGALILSKNNKEAIETT